MSSFGTRSFGSVEPDFRMLLLLRHLRDRRFRRRCGNSLAMEFVINRKGVTIAMSATSLAVVSGSGTRRSRRKIERIRLVPPVTGQLGSTPVVVSDLSLTGAGVEHQGSFAVGAKARLTFRWNGESVTIGCTVLRCRLIGFASGAQRLTVYSTGLAFDEESVAGEHPIRRMIEASVIRALDEQKANARGIRREREPRSLFAGRSEEPSDPRTSLLMGLSHESGYCTFRLSEGRWRKSRTNRPDQPPEGFTVWASEDPDQLELLCLVYEKSDDSMRKMIRILAQLSVSEPERESHRRYVP
ncbi:MAG TPA: PilZ domain-containing protein [Thermoanaerobaculia bacterium]|nr:PilZ domain-containing protein [Thermoanaerobaculia bacterium]